MSTALHWFRRDLRVRDNNALYDACAGHNAVAGIFVIDPRWLGDPGKLGAFQAAFLLESLRELSAALAQRNIPLLIRRDTDPVRAVLQAAQQIGADTITYNRDYEPAQVAQDRRLERTAAGVTVRSVKDSVIFEEREILTQAECTYSVFTPYKRAWLKRLGLRAGQSAPLDTRGLPRRSACMLAKPEAVPTPAALQYPAVTLDTRPGERAGQRQLERFIAHGLLGYQRTRDFPALGLEGPSTSRLSAHLAAGTLSPRQVIAAAWQQRPNRGGAAASVDTFISELIWREFYRMVLCNFPHTVKEPFARRYRRVTWGNDPQHVEAWATGRTGYPLIDAAMAQLRQTGFMHNRLRMLTAMFLTKDLDCHWLLGERYFMRALVDYDQAANVGGWQWAASTGTDAVPYFRVMNPVRQAQRYDPDGIFIRHYLPALRRVPDAFVHAPWKMALAIQQQVGCIIGEEYPAPIVDHTQTRARVVAKFRAV